MITRLFSRLSFQTIVVSLGAATTVALLFAVVTWEHEHDTALMNYVGYLMSERGLLPYRDMSEASFPVSMLFHYLVNEFGLARDPQFLILGWSLTILVGLMASVAMQPLCGRHRFLFAAIYVPAMIMMGPESILQRDWLALLFIAPAMILAFRQVPKYRPLRLLLIGGLFGMAALVKPQMALGAPVFVLADVALSQKITFGEWRSVVRNITNAVAFSLAGFFAILIIAAGVLYFLGVWPDFAFLVFEYLPTYVGRTFDHVYLPPGQHGRYILDHIFVIRQFRVLLIGAALLLVLTIIKPPQTRAAKIVIMSLLAATVVYALTPAISGQFWDYHYLPFMFFVITPFAPLLMVDTIFGYGRAFTWAIRAVAVAVVLFNVDLPKTFDTVFRPGLAKDGNIAKYEAVIQKWLPEGGKIQPLAMAEGFYHAMLRQKVQVATPYLYEHVFYHNVGSEINQKMRADFIAKLKIARPELIILAKLRDRVSGYRVSYDFRELDIFLIDNYEIVANDALVIVHRRKDLGE